MRTKSIGEILQEEREAHRVSLEFLAQKSKINPDFLVALENNRYQDLPSAIYIKSFIKTYAKIFGFDHQPLFAMLRRDYQENEKGRLIKRQEDGKGRHRSWRQADLLVFSSIAIFLTLIIFIAFKWQQFNKAPELKVDSPAEMATVKQKLAISGQTEAEAILEINSQPVAIQTDGNFTYELFLARTGINTITIKASNQKGKSTLIQRSVNVSED